MEHSNTGSMIAILLLDAAPKLSAEAIAKQLRSLRPDAAEKIEVSSSGESFLVTMGADVLTVMFVSQPVPAGALDRALDGMITWPEAKDAVTQHRHHVIVGSLQNKPEKLARISAATSVTSVCCAIIGLTDCLGVYWAASETLSEPKHVVAETALVLDGPRAPDFWTRLYLFRGDPIGGIIPVGCVTLGLAAISGREIEFEPVLLHPTVVAQRVLGAAHLLLFGTKEIKDGDTIGVSASERIRARHAAKGKRAATPVVSLQHEING